ncbi:MAG: CDP-alcohol phosphatidyltransferase family protein [Spirochaetes bacterium]|nr:CDP-alcohol phosphatidyltransferase family protein [Spirochaetota bacterium]
MDFFILRTRLTRSIHLTFESFLLVQFAMFGAFCALFGMPLEYFLLFAASAAGFHLFVLVVLMQFLPDFVILETGEKLERVNLANRITLARLSTLPTILFLLMASRDYPVTIPVFVLIAAVFLTDFMDGYISRTTHQVTKIGKILDSVSDYSLLFFLAIALFYLGLIPPWFFLLVVVRLVSQSILATILVFVHRTIDARSTLFGKAAVASTMTVFGFEILRLLVADPNSVCWSALEFAGGFVIFVSIFDKIILFACKLKEAPERPKSAIAPDLTDRSGGTK